MAAPTATDIGYWTAHAVNTGGGRNDDPDPKWQATCETCGWIGTKAPRSEAGWQIAADEARQHNSESRAWVPVTVDEEPDIVYVCENVSYDAEGVTGVYASLHAALVANPCPWRESGSGSWRREDGDAIRQTATLITRYTTQR